MAEEQRILHPEWRAENEPTAYPFADTATLRNGALFIPAELFLDAILYPIGADIGLYLTKVVIDRDQAVFYIGDQSEPELASGTFALGSPPDSLAIYDAHGRPAGLLVSASGRLSFFQSWPVGIHTFSQEQTLFAAAVHVPMPDYGLRGFVLEDGSIVSGDVWLVGEDGVVLTPETHTPTGFTEDNTEQQVIRVDIVGDPLFRRRICDTVFETPRFIEQITFRQGNLAVVCGPDELGDLKITAGRQRADDSVLRIRQQPDRGILFETIGQRLS